MDDKFSTFVMSETTLNQIKALPPDTQLKFFWAVANFGTDGIEPEFEGVELAVWIPMRDLILHTKRKDEKWRQKQHENGKKGGRPKTQNNPNEPTETQNNPNETWDISKSHNDNNNDKDNDNENLNNNDKLGLNTETPQGLFLYYWQHNPDIFDFQARIENWKEWDKFWKKSHFTCSQIKTAMDNFILDVREGVIERKYVPLLPDRFILNGWLTKCQERLKPDKKPPHKIAADNVPQEKALNYFREAE